MAKLTNQLILNYITDLEFEQIYRLAQGKLIKQMTTR